MFKTLLFVLQNENSSHSAENSLTNQPGELGFEFSYEMYDNIACA